MSACVVWIDSEHAKLFSITVDGVKKSELKNHHHTHNNNNQEDHKKNEEEHFYKEVAISIGQVEELLVMGPGTAKSHFKHHLEKHHAHDLSKHVVGIETVDKLSDGQILEHSRKFFKKYNQFHSGI